MDPDGLRTFLLSLRFTEETHRDRKLVFRIGAKALGEKMFAPMEVENQLARGRERPPLLSSCAGDLYDELLHRETFL